MLRSCDPSSNLLVIVQTVSIRGVKLSSVECCLVLGWMTFWGWAIVPAANLAVHRWGIGIEVQHEGTVDAGQEKAFANYFRLMILSHIYVVACLQLKISTGPKIQDQVSVDLTGLESWLIYCLLGFGYQLSAFVK